METRLVPVLWMPLTLMDKLRDGAKTVLAHGAPGHLPIWTMLKATGCMLVVEVMLATILLKRQRQHKGEMLIILGSLFTASLNISQPTTPTQRAVPFGPLPPTWSRVTISSMLPTIRASLPAIRWWLTCHSTRTVPRLKAAFMTPSIRRTM